MMKVHPEMVHMGATGFYQVDVPDAWKLIKAIQELKAENDNLVTRIVNFFCSIKAFRRIATRYEKTDKCFAAIINLVAAVLWTFRLASGQSLGAGTPGCPAGPTSPRMPWGPAGPCNPASPLGPAGPGGPGSPRSP
jgi:hypothetical protein